jgi:2-polyprenyl-3-methyl-5-hydroxy-6-metoxy-1,4-benzoquinol methylase
VSADEEGDGPADLGARVRQRFAVDDRPVSTIGPGGELSSPADARARAWLASLPADRYEVIEHLVPRIDRAIERTQPEFQGRQRGQLDLTSEEIKARVDELAPWHVPFALGFGRVTVRDALQAAAYEERLLFRRDLINGTLADLLGSDLAGTTALDIGCNCGYFSLDLATRGAAHVDGVDLRPENIAQAEFLAEHFGVDNVSFHVADAADLAGDRQWDVVLNLGLLYHVTEPFELVRQTYELCRRAAIIDTVCLREPVSAFFTQMDRDVSSHAEGRAPVELHPTYRAVIDTLHHAGFSEVFELTGHCDDPHPSYAKATRRCFLVMK